MKNLTILLLFLTPIFLNGQIISSSGWGGAGSTASNNQVVKILGSDFSINSTALVDIPNFSHTILTGETWLFEVHLMVEAQSTAADIRSRVNVTGNGRFSMNNIEQASTYSPNVNTTSSSMNMLTIGGTNSDSMILKGSCTATADGTITIQLRNNVGTDTQTFDAFSSVIFTKVD